MRNGFNQFSIPYMNELTANQLGAAAQFGGNMPLNFINSSLGRIAQFFQDGRPQDRITDPRVWDRIIRGLPGQTPDPATARTPPIVPPSAGCPPGEVEYKDIFGFSRCGKRTISDGPGTVGDDPTRSGQKAEAAIGAVTGAVGGIFSPDWINSAGGKDTAKRVGLVLLGGALLIVAIVSLR